jgi:hypothetical protein
MKKSRKIAVGVVMVLGIAVGAVAVWSLGARASQDIPVIRLEAVQGTVEIKRVGESQFAAANGALEVHPDDEIRTGADGKVAIRWGDRGETRLDANTDLTIVAAPADDATTQAKVELELSSGRVWSRVLKLLDVDSGFDVKTDAVVATVRGTAFGVAKVDADSQLAVTESVVDVAPRAGGSSTLLKEGKWGNFSATGTPTIVRDLTPADAWPAENKKLDDQFDTELRQELETRMKQQDSSAPEWLMDLSETIHLSLTSSEQKDGLIASYMNRRIMEAVDRPSDAPILLQFDPAWFKIGPAARDSVLQTIRAALFITAPRPGVPAPDLYARLEELRTRLLGTPYATALTIDDQIDQLVFPVSPLSPEDKQSQGDHLLQLIQDWKNGLPTDGVSNDDLTALNNKAEALRLRLVDDGLGAPSGDTAPTSTATTTDPLVPTSTRTGVPVVTAPSSTTPAPASGASTPTSTSQGCVFRTFSLIARPAANVEVGQAVSLSFFGICTNGQVEDLTSSSVFSVSPEDGQISGTTFTPSHAGSISVHGTDDTHVANATVVVIRSSASSTSKKLTGVSVSAIGPTSLTTGQSAPLVATATYSDGTSMDVTYQCAWTTSDAKLGTISSQRFYAGTGTGSVAAVCSYTEGGVSKTGSATFAISLDPALMPAGGGTAQTYTFFAR